MSNNENVKKKVGMNINSKVIIGFLLLFTFPLFNEISFFIGDFERGFERSGVI